MEMNTSNVEALLARIAELEEELDEFRPSEAEQYRMANGHCEDAPCCGCCGNWE